MFLGTHDPTQLNRQGNDVGTQYRSAIFVTDESQRGEAEAAIARWNADHPGQKAVTTIEGPAEWFAAEDYHQEYWGGEGQRNPLLPGDDSAQAAEVAQELPEPGSRRMRGESLERFVPGRT